MCGIAGFCDFNKKTGATVLQEMTGVLAYRGPDDAGYSLSEDAHAQIGLGHRRLSIIDLSPLGHQPMLVLNGRYKIIFNGEIYNYKEIRKELEALGHQFNTHSDTEVIVLSIHQWGINAIHRFIGMFAFAIHDTAEDLLWIVRDRAGVKPLYYYWKNELFLFGSELKAFHKHPHFEKEMNLQAVELFFELGYIPAPHSIFNHAYKLRPGHYL